jgi:acyl carrier protein
MDINRASVIEMFQESAKRILDVDPSEVQESTSFQADLDADSLDVVEVIMGVEEALDMSFPDDLWDGVTNVGEAADRIVEFVRSGP